MMQFRGLSHFAALCDFPGAGAVQRLGGRLSPRASKQTARPLFDSSATCQGRQKCNCFHMRHLGF